MIELRTKLTQAMKTIHPKVYFQRASEDNAFPYLTYTFLPSYMVDEGTEIIPMDVDVWDNQTDTTELETIAQSIWNIFNGYDYVDDTIYFRVLRENRFPELEDDEPSIRRRKLTFQIRYMYKGGTN